jgi:exodeoxyribonuclease V alpha subunit
MEINYHRHGIAAMAGRAALMGRFYPGEPVVATRNDYDVGMTNGELGTVGRPAPGGGLCVRFDDGERALPTEYVEKHLELAYAITCHKSQGSQWPRVIVPVTQSKLLDRTLLLTAVSRAQKQVVLVGDRAAFERAVVAPPASLDRAVASGGEPRPRAPHPAAPSPTSSDHRR